MKIAETIEGRITEADVRSAGMRQDATSDLREMDPRLYQLLVACTKGDACNTERSGFKAWKSWSVTSIRERVQTDLSRTRGRDSL